MSCCYGLWAKRSEIHAEDAAWSNRVGHVAFRVRARRNSARGD